MHYFQFHIADYQSATKHLTPIEDICLRRLLDWQYLNEKPIPNDLTQVARLLMLKGYEHDLEQVLVEYFNLINDGWINQKAFAEIEVYKSRAATNSENGKKSAEKRRAKSEQTLNEPLMKVEPTINQKPLTNNQEPLASNHQPLPSSQKSRAVNHDKTPLSPILGDRVQSDDIIDSIFRYWQTVMNHPKSLLSEKTIKLIKARLKEGFTPELLREAIDGCSKTPHNMGMNERNTRYDSLDLILRDGENVNRFVANNSKQPIYSEKLSAAGNKTLAAGMSWLASDFNDEWLTEKEVFTAGEN